MKRNPTSPIKNPKVDSTLAHLRALYARRVAVDRLIVSLEDYRRATAISPAGKAPVKVLKQAA